jgi:hypothetical protein
MSGRGFQTSGGKFERRMRGGCCRCCCCCCMVGVVVAVVVVAAAAWWGWGEWRSQSLMPLRWRREKVGGWRAGSNSLSFSLSLSLPLLNISTGEGGVAFSSVELWVVGESLFSLFPPPTSLSIPLSTSPPTLQLLLITDRHCCGSTLFPSQPHHLVSP